MFPLENDGYRTEINSRALSWPKNPVCQVPERVPEPLASAFRQAHDILLISPKAGAALSRRCLQAIIEGQEEIRERSLMRQVKKLIDLNKLPTYLAEDLDAIRVVGMCISPPAHRQRPGFTAGGSRR